MCICLYIYIYTYLGIYIYIHIHVCIFVCLFVCMINCVYICDLSEFCCLYVLVYTSVYLYMSFLVCFVSFCFVWIISIKFWFCSYLVACMWSFFISLYSWLCVPVLIVYCFLDCFFSKVLLFTSIWVLSDTYKSILIYLLVCYRVCVGIYIGC